MADVHFYPLDEVVMATKLAFTIGISPEVTNLS
jgi:hypothetical protein